MTCDRPVVLAVITGAHGVDGAVKLKMFTGDLTPYRVFNDGALRLRSLNGSIARFDGVIDRNAAEQLRGTQLTVARDALPPLGEGEYYYFDLIGLPVVSTEGAALGHVVAVENFGAGDVLEIERPDKTRFMVPMRPDAVPEWGERVVIDSVFAG